MEIPAPAPDERVQGDFEGLAEAAALLAAARRPLLWVGTGLLLFIDNPDIPMGRVDGRRGGGRLPVALAVPFGHDASVRLAMTPFPAAAHRTGRADLTHPALIRDFPSSHSSGSCFAQTA